MICEVVYTTCVKEINEAHVLLLLADSYGIDCSWEVGYARGISKRIIVIVENEKGLVRLREDWMIKGAIDAVLITDRELYKIASGDQILQNKKLVLTNFENIHRAFLSLMEDD